MRWDLPATWFYSTAPVLCLFSAVSQRAVLQKQGLAWIWHQHAFENRALPFHAGEDRTYVVSVVSKY